MSPRHRPTGAFFSLLTAAMLIAPISAPHAAQKTLESMRARLDEAKPDVLLVGNSMIREGLSDDTLGKLSGLKIARLFDNGALSAWQFMGLANVVGPAAHRPRWVVLITRENFITFPNLRAGDDTRRGRAYKRKVDALRAPTPGAAEKTLDALAYSLPSKNYRGPAPHDLGEWDFSRAVDRSFLPHMLQLARDKGYVLVIARHKPSRAVRGATNHTPDTAAHRQYRDALATYVTAQGGVFLDYTVSPVLRPEHYRKGGGDDHLNAAGQRVWSKLLGEDLNALSAGSVAPNQRTGAVQK